MAYSVRLRRREIGFQSPDVGRQLRIGRAIRRNDSGGACAPPFEARSVPARTGKAHHIGKPHSPEARALAWNKPFYGGAITSKFSFSQKYGYFEIEARLPAGKGMWPAFWLMPVGGSWPDDGEIDIFEGLGDPHTIFCTVIAGPHKKTMRIRLDFDVSSGFHRYGVLWRSEETIWYVDRKPVVRAPTPAALTTQEAYVIANLAVGGSWGGYPDGTTRFPGRYEVRRITVWPLPQPTR